MEKAKLTSRGIAVAVHAELQASYFRATTSSKRKKDFKNVQDRQSTPPGDLDSQAGDWGGRANQSMNAVWGKRTETLSRAAGTKTSRRRSAGAYTKTISARLFIENSPPAISGRGGQNKYGRGSINNLHCYRVSSCTLRLGLA